MPATVKDVAKVAKVSVGTVSRVLSGEPNVATETTKRVMKAVEQLGYSRLRKRKTAAHGRELVRKNVAMLLMGMDRSLVGLPSVASGMSRPRSLITYRSGSRSPSKSLNRPTNA